MVNGKRGRAAEAAGDADGGIWTAGQVIGLIQKIPTCRQLMDDLVREAEETIQERLSGMLVKDQPINRSKL